MEKPEKDKITVLVVDDEESIRKVVGSFLEFAGFQVLIARHGAEALFLSDLHQGSIQILITDLVMPPYMNGYELAESLRSRRPEMKVLYISGYAADAMVQQEVLNDMSDFLAKPFTRRKLLEKVTQLLASENCRNDEEGTEEPETILLLLDAHWEQRPISYILAQRGYLVLEARQLGDALIMAQWHEGRIHLFLADENLAYTLGGEWMERLRECRREMKVLFIPVAEELPSHANNLEAAEFLPLPFTPDSLERKVRELLDQT